MLVLLFSCTIIGLQPALNIQLYIICFRIYTESSYGDDSEDSDWVLEKTDGRAGTPPDEDIAELLNDAEEFISSKKMRRTT